MNIYTQVCGLVIIAMLLFFYIKQPTMGLSSERKFKFTLFIILGCVLLDIASCYFIVKSRRYEEYVVIAICKLYLISLHCVAFSALGYAISDIFEHLGSANEKFLGVCYQIFCIIGVIITVYLPLHYYYDGQTLYTYGPAAIATYFFVSVYILSIIIAATTLKNHLKEKKIYALYLWMAVWAISAIIQFLNPKLLIVSFASCIGALIMYFELENPQSSLSRRTGHFSSAVIHEYLEYLYQTKQNFSAMRISFQTAGESSDENKLLRQTIEMLSDFLFSIDTAKIFDTAEGYFLLIFENTDFLESTKYQISTYFQAVENSSDVGNAVTLLRPFYTIIPDCTISEDADELMMLLANYIPTNKGNSSTNEVVVTAETMKNIRRQKDIEKLVIEAMENDRVEVHYQPIFNIATNTFSSAEALVRIKLIDGTYLQPNEFIPVAESSGRIIPLSDAIYRSALSFIKSYHVERLGIQHIELNLSVKQGESPTFTTKILQLLEDYQINPEIINLEITETSSLRSKERLHENMKKLEEHGLCFSLDDFGSGSSNLNYIIDMPVSIVKLDKLLSDEYFKNSEKAKAIVNAVIEMAHSIGIKIVAEGIETQEEFDTMKALGVDYIQGFFFSKPLPEHEFLKFIQNNNLKYMYQ
ncbi:EAL domain-containing protein [Pseudobutyrivibrio xylanivorans]|uniref:EAL domain, c-di-GMP-specific phosphodiesterase class I (Or its enzymatically inactive variant) n=1 Tax=Pseudobutyrivibrio xylanivorans DSM 14809 TaxID=1123012 RepID=A0A1M6A0W8_PSEXY|nr:EAL domain-containing protein [Pseudobutyrivibrio xylanivorans]SHI30174.1 EAL domain, c-di-GMP-specific phosphodiesterase class I (or its enzymatically inactive variant) [Pseudobutyrivibrio xylanivorans DSM 14809]